MTTNRLADRVALVFGAGSVGPGWGNGKASAVAYARAGARVVCVDINRSAAEETVGLIRGEGGSAEALACDVTKLMEVEDVVARTTALFGPVDILHNNVGHAKMGGPPDLTEDEWRREMDLNVTGMFLACKVVIPTMVARGKGVITNISSSAGIRYVGYPYTSYYAAKGAVNQFTVGVALQYARDGLRCNAILPGLMDTPLIYQQITVQYASPDDMVKARHEATPMGRMGTGWDVANAAVFLASDEASYINAVCLPVDGGFTARCA
ncbi:MAG: SDR family oxidoreductase [Phreatobacter sp.]|uniref:SDR family NAD(P)-dependent oxidoreductase n=1 Tax=Phreatobacter sp. TaxID=1966341 RepID=UPI0027353CBB|nr:SDR family oxidoreductase [Phreatobacter sp.]MDP2801973.1 SDR family oxidoreductase [Phreatobacter sp.]